MKIEEDEIIGGLFDTPEKKARWLRRITIIYICWIIFLIVGLLAFFLYWII